MIMNRVKMSQDTSPRERRTARTNTEIRTLEAQIATLETIETNGKLNAIGRKQLNSARIQIAELIETNE